MKWEYFTISPFAEKIPWGDKLNQLGQEGWELVVVVHPRWVFKRQIEEVQKVKGGNRGSRNKLVTMALQAIEERKYQNE